jgi:ribonuclease Z
VSARELVVLGTASQVPTRTRNHNGYLLRWDRHGILFDPGEGTQRQLILAGVPASAITAICLTHAHGDHCLGLPGVLQRLSMDGVDRPIPLVYPAAAGEYVARLRRASSYVDRLEVVPYPVAADAAVLTWEGLTLEAAALEHRVPTYGWVRTERGMVRLEEVSRARPGQRFGFVMDTVVCDGARWLAQRADLLVCEATYATADADRAAAYRHLTARQAGQIAAGGRARRLVLTHFSQRYTDPVLFGRQAREAGFEGDLTVAEDLMRVPVPKRR